VKIAAGFHVRDDDWILPRKLEALSSFCSRIVVVLDRPTDATREILARFPLVEGHEHVNTLGLPDEGPDGPVCEEGRMRQRTWDLLAEGSPDWIVLGDADEIPTPDVVPFLASDPDVDLVYLHTVNLYQSPDRWISGPRCVWSPEHPGSNKKGVLVRFDARRHAAGGYRYDPGVRHVRLEPSPRSRLRHVLTPRHVLADAPKLVHWKWVNWQRWEASAQARLPKYQRLWDGLELSATPPEWHWQVAPTGYAVASKPCSLEGV